MKQDIMIFGSNSTMSITGKRVRLYVCTRNHRL
jgi:hypothetical protein